MKEDGKSFLDILHTYIEILERLKSKLEDKKIFWNKNGRAIIEDKRLSEEYSKPM